MFLRSISTEELNFEKSWNLGLKKIKNLSRFDKYMTIFKERLELGKSIMV